MLQTFKHGSLRINIDDNNPRRGRSDIFGNIVCWSDANNIGDPHGFATPVEFSAWLKQNPAIILPIYLFGQHLQTTPSGSKPLGYIYATLRQVRLQYPQRATSRVREKVAARLRQEVEEYDAFLNAKIYDYEIRDSQDRLCEAFWGFSNLDDCRAAALAAAAALLEQEQNHAGNQVL